MLDWNEWGTFLNELEAKKKELDFVDDEYLVYRGEADTNYRLLPTLYRQSGPDPDKYWELESDLFFEFQARSREVREGMSDWDTLFLMRHHGVPTRLLDWTEVLGVALLFAVLGYDPRAKGKEKRTPCIWVLNPWALNEESWAGRDLVAPRFLGWNKDYEDYDDYGEILATWDEFRNDLPVAIYPRQSNPRMAAQRGLFTIHGNSISPMQDVCKKYVRKVEMSDDVVCIVATLLRIVGFDQYLVYPDPDNLAIALRELNGFPVPADKRRPRPEDW